MGVAVLSPESCLRGDFSHQRRPLISPPRSKPRRSPAIHIASPEQTRSGRRRRQWSPAGSPPPPSPPLPKPGNDGKAYRAKSPVVAGQVRILKRGEDLTPTKLPTPTATPVKGRRTKREGSLDYSYSEPLTAPSLNIYAGSVVFTSPPPSSVPLPLFCTKQIGAGAGGLPKCSAEAAAVDLRRMLRLE